jgi:prepilin-type N-terminal cleavage/methylation domain-containing protein
MNLKKQSGFTLVEIAIVLVIIGLLLGGILKGQELINSARVRNIADQGSATQAAYYGFIDRYRQVPGDWAQAAATIGIGTAIVSPLAANANAGNGRIDTNDYDEASAVWEQLSKAGFINGLYVGAGAVGNFIDGTRAPVNAFNGTVALSRFSGTNVAANDYQGTGGNRLSYVYGPQIPATIMRELDVKLDDGAPTTGIVRAVRDGGGTTNLSVILNQPGGAVACVDAGFNWDVTNASQDCNGIFLY